MLPFKEMVKTREKTDLQNLGVNQEFSFGYIQTEMSVIDPRGTIDKQAAGYLSLKLGGWVRVEAVIVATSPCKESPAAPNLPIGVMTFLLPL